MVRPINLRAHQNIGRRSKQVDALHARLFLFFLHHDSTLVGNIDTEASAAKARHQCRVVQDTADLWHKLTLLFGHGPVKLVREGCCAAELLSADGLLYLPTVARAVVSHANRWLRERDGLHGILLRVVKLDRLVWLENDALVAVWTDDL